jgi:hypothetical protein
MVCQREVQKKAIAEYVYKKCGAVIRVATYDSLEDPRGWVVASLAPADPNRSVDDWDEVAKAVQEGERRFASASIVHAGYV